MFGVLVIVLDYEDECILGTVEESQKKFGFQMSEEFFYQFLDYLFLVIFYVRKNKFLFCLGYCYVEFYFFLIEFDVE